jgi:hypothetical protein
MSTQENEIVALRRLLQEKTNELAAARRQLADIERITKDALRQLRSARLDLKMQAWS